MTTAKLILESGKIFTGRVFSKGKEAFGEAIFTTGMSGYQEVITDPSYLKQIVVLTYPLIGNYGIVPSDSQSSKVHLSALIIKEYANFVSNFEAKESLHTFLERFEVMGIEGIDTRALTRYLRTHGAQKALVTTSTDSDSALIERVRSQDCILGQNLAKEVSCKESYLWKSVDTPKFNVAVIDCGVKFGILDELTKRGCQVTVFPYTVSADTLLSGCFDGVLVSNGPGQPDPVTEVIQTIRDIAGKLPLFGICLGHQLLSLAFNMKIMKLPFGHHGLNHPMLNTLNGSVDITSQNHIYCTDPSSLHPDFVVSHINLNDGSIAGIRSNTLKAFSVQHHPEAAPGPREAASLFDEFISLMATQTFKEHTPIVSFKGGLTHA